MPLSDSVPGWRAGVRRAGAWLAAPISPERRAWQALVPVRVAHAVLRRYLADMPPIVSASPPPLELFLRVGPRDRDIAPLALDSVRRYLRNPIERVVIATPGALVDWARDAFPEIEVVADEDLLAAPMQSAIDASAPPGRGAWIAQQFLTLVFVSTRAQGPCLVWDADTVMVRPHTLFDGHAAALPVSLEHHRPYFDAIRSLCPTLPLPRHASAVGHHMVMEPELLRELFDEIERGHPSGCWWRALVAQIDVREAAPISEYELYGQWVRTRHSDRVRPVTFHNVTIARERWLREPSGALRDLGKVDSASAHWWCTEPVARSDAGRPPLG